MDRFIIKKGSLDDDNELNVAGTSSGSITHTTVNVGSKIVVPDIMKTICPSGSSGEKQPRPMCVVCGQKPANEAMVPSNLKSHLRAKHSHICEKPIECFKRLTADRTHQAKQWTKTTTISDSAEEVRYAVAKSWQKIKSHTIAEPVILPACCKIVNIMFGEEYEKEILDFQNP
jgi:hypothetical protein